MNRRRRVVPSSAAVAETDPGVIGGVRISSEMVGSHGGRRRGGGGGVAAREIGVSGGGGRHHLEGCHLCDRKRVSRC